MAKTITYRISENKQYNSTEVYFSEKPSQATLDALHTVKYRWNHLTKAWYGFLTKEELKDVLTNPKNAQAMAEKKAEERKKVWAEKKAQAKKAETPKAEPKAKKSKAEPKAETKAQTKKCALTERGKAVKSKGDEIVDIRKATKSKK